MRRYAPLRRSKPLKPGKPLAGGGPIARTKPLPKSNPARKARLYVRNYASDDYREWLTSHPCAIPGCPNTDVVAAHARSKGAGGDWRDLFPCCNAHHREQHDIGVQTWSAKYAIDASVIACFFAGVWLERGGREPGESPDVEG